MGILTPTGLQVTDNKFQRSLYEISRSSTSFCQADSRRFAFDSPSVEKPGKGMVQPRNGPCCPDISRSLGTSLCALEGEPTSLDTNAAFVVAEAEDYTVVSATRRWKDVANDWTDSVDNVIQPKGFICERG